MQNRTPLELVAEEIRSQLHFSKPGDVYVWGSGANYQLGTGSTENHDVPVRLDSFGDDVITVLAASKFHTAAISKDGKLYTWGWGRGGRLGHADFEGGSKQRLLAQIHPLRVAGLNRYRVTGVAAAKHHTLACTSDGYVYVSETLIASCQNLKLISLASKILWGVLSDSGSGCSVLVNIETVAA